MIMVLVGIPLLVLLLEFIARGAFLATGNPAAVNSAVALTQAYGLHLQDSAGNLYPGVKAGGQLQVRRSPLLGYEIVPSQKNDYFQINPQGFRQDTAVPADKSPNELRIFVLGASTAFGNYSTKNEQTLAFQLEKLLNERVREQNRNPAKYKPKELPFFADQIEAMRSLPPRIKDGDYRVITAAVPGYTSGNELALLSHRVMAYSPDALIILDGYEDLRSPSQETAHEVANIEQMLQDPMSQYRQQISQQFQQWLGSWYLVKAWQRWIVPQTAQSVRSNYQEFRADQFSNDPKEIKQRLERYRYNLQQMTHLTIDLPTIVAIQPEITGKSNLAKDEAEIIKTLGKEYNAVVTKAYEELAKVSKLTETPKMRSVNLYSFFSNSNEKTFVDPIHLSEAGNKMLASKLFTLLEESLNVKPVAPNTEGTNSGANLNSEGNSSNGFRGGNSRAINETNSTSTTGQQFWGNQR
jgi:lysophospholipase L1-like esterase